jgi:uncharacterized protein YegL
MADPIDLTGPIHAYLLLDTSASMFGAPLEALKQGLRLLCGTFISRSKRPVRISLIGYDSAAREIAPLQDVTDFEMPKLDAAGSSGLGGAFRLLARTMPEHSPSLVYVFTDGEPTDDWEVAIEALRPRVVRVVGVVCGLTANGAVLEPVLDRVFQMRELTPDLLFDTFRAFE